MLILQLLVKHILILTEIDMTNILPRSSSRIPEIDRLRGLVMVLMALDHMRDFLDADALRFNPTDLCHTYPILFFTRLVTHLCAPTFAFLAGCGAFLYGDRIKNFRALSQFLISRGFWLIALDIFLVGPVFAGGPGKAELGTLWAIGCGLVALSALCRLRAEQVLIIGLVIVFGHDILDGVHASDLGVYGPWWRLLHERGDLPFGIPGSVVYPILPWIGVVALGYGFGQIFLRPEPVREGIIRVSGYCALLIFVVLRTINSYGDPVQWTIQNDKLSTFLSFLNVSKYPPSLLYLMLTLGISALIMGPLTRMRAGINKQAGDALAVFGRTPLLFYISHLYLGAAAGLIVAHFQGYSFQQISEFIQSKSVPEDLGLGLIGAYVGWIAVVLLLYPVCRQFDRFKQRRSDLWILRYL
jgi:uncharacterized membrane protein